MATGIIFDTEVNSIDHKECIELGYAKVNDDGGLEVTEPICERFKPQNPIEAGAAAVHFITPQELADCRQASEAEVPQVDYLIAHNVDFDCEVLGIMWGRRICTLALCRYLWPEFKQHTLSAMFLELNGISRQTVDRVREAHAADEDVKLLIDVIGHIVQKAKYDHRCQPVASLKDLWELSEVARVKALKQYA
jgi:exodeoxyribonuclease X